MVVAAMVAAMVVAAIVAAMVEAMVEAIRLKVMMATFHWTCGPQVAYGSRLW
jgi:hypothetical protein